MHSSLGVSGMASRVSAKIQFGPHSHILQLTLPISKHGIYQSLLHANLPDFETALSVTDLYRDFELSFEDEEGDRVTVSNHDDFVEALEVFDQLQEMPVFRIEAPAFHQRLRISDSGSAYRVLPSSTSSTELDHQTTTSPNTSSFTARLGLGLGDDRWGAPGSYSNRTNIFGSPDASTGIRDSLANTTTTDINQHPPSSHNNNGVSLLFQGAFTRDRGAPVATPTLVAGGDPNHRSHEDKGVNLLVGGSPFTASRTFGNTVFGGSAFGRSGPHTGDHPRSTTSNFGLDNLLPAVNDDRNISNTSGLTNHTGAGLLLPSSSLPCSFGSAAMKSV